MRITNKFDLPDPVFKALTHDDYSRGDSQRSVTQLIDSPRVRILKHEHEDEIEMDASDLVWMALGKAVHRMFEDFTEGGRWEAERRVFADMLGWTVSGQMDIQEIDAETVSLHDYKVTSVWSYIHWKETFDQQLNFYAWLVRQQGGVKPYKLYIIFVFRDWKKSEALRNADYPPSSILQVEVPMWSDEAQDEFVEERVRLHQQAEFERLTGNTLPDCTPEERWERPTTFAVKKPANKRAKRVFSCFEDAALYVEEHGLKGFEVEVRKGKPTRCSDGWCLAADFCDQWAREKNESFDE